MARTGDRRDADKVLVVKQGRKRPRGRAGRRRDDDTGNDLKQIGSIRSVLD